jgi:arylformamidase
MQRIIDISLPISAIMPVYPGTGQPTIETVVSSSGSNVLSRITMTSHTGTHVDAPAHSLPGAAAIDTLPLDAFYGDCRVLDMTSCETSIPAAALQSLDIQAGERILFKTTHSARGFATFYDDYVFLSPEAAEYLTVRRVALVGIDSLSIKQRGSPDNTPHTALLGHNIPILEGLNLSDAAPGEYTLCAFPLAFTGIDGAPARAILLSNE